MVKAFLVVGLLAVAALGVTVLAVAQSDAWTGERTYSFQATTAALPASEPLPAGAAPARFSLNLPANATAVAGEATIAFTGQAVQGGNAAVRIKTIAPDGRTTATTTALLPVAQGATSGQVVVPFNLTWLEVPASVTDTQQPDGQAWALPLRIEITVERPADLPVATYGFTATLAGTLAGYAANLA